MKLGPRWTEDECHLFFESFKENGRVWTKVAAGIPNRTASMCEALFNLNKSFLSLPTNAISGVALSALVTDHYNNLPLDERDRDSASLDTSAMGGGGGSGAAAATAAGEGRQRGREETPERGKGDATVANGGGRGTPSRASRGRSEDGGGGGATPRGVSGSKARASPARKPPGGGGGGANGITSSKDGRVVGRRTPRSNPNVHHKGERAAAAAAGLTGKISDIDVLEMAGQALVSMSPGPALPKGLRTPTHSRITPGSGAKGFAGQRRNKGKGAAGGFHEDQCSPLRTIAQQPFGSPTPSPGKKRGQKRGRELFPTGTGTDGSDEEMRGGGMDGLLDGLLMLADASTLAEPAAKRKRKPKAEKPPRVPTPSASPARGGGRGRGVGGAASLRDPLREAAVRGAAAGKSGGDGDDGLTLGLRTPIGGGLGIDAGGDGHTPGASRRSALKSTPPVRMCEGMVDGIADRGGFKSPAGRGVLPGTPGGPGSLQDMGLGGVGPHHVGELHLLEEMVRDGGKAVMPAPPFGGLLAGLHRSVPSSARRRWFLAENFYSSIDKPWFTKTGFAEYLKHCGLDHIDKFTRNDWRIIRQSLGKPRRLSLPFLRRERLELERHRASIRDKHFQITLQAIQAAALPSTGGPPKQPLTMMQVAAAADEDRTPLDGAEGKEEGTADAKPAAGEAAREDPTHVPKCDAVDGTSASVGPGAHEDDIPPPLRVGDRVVARHARAGNVHVGSVLTVQGKRCLVQFDRHELGVELVRDINIAHLPRTDEEEEEEDAFADKAGDLAQHGAPDDRPMDAALAAAAAHTQQWAAMQRLPGAGVERGGPMAGAGATTAATSVNAKATAEATSAATAAAAAVAAAAAAAAEAAVRGKDPVVDIQRIARATSDTRFDEAAPETTAAIAAAVAAARASLAITADEPMAAATGAATRMCEEDLRALEEVSRALDLKETLVAELRCMNDRATESKTDVDVKMHVAVENDGNVKPSLDGIGGTASSSPVTPSAGGPAPSPSPPASPSEPFQRQYASTMLRIRECNQQLQVALVRLREQHRLRESCAPSKQGQAWRRFMRGGDKHVPSAISGAGDFGQAASVSEVSAAAEERGGMVGGRAAGQEVDIAAEIVAASKFSGYCMLMVTQEKTFTLATADGDAPAAAVAEAAEQAEKETGKSPGEPIDGKVPLDTDHRAGAADDVAMDCGDHVDKKGDVTVETAPPVCAGKKEEAEDDDGVHGETEVDGAIENLIAKSLGSFLAIKVCIDHGVAPALTAEVMDRCLASLRPMHPENENAYFKLKTAFDELKVQICDTR